MTPHAKTALFLFPLFLGVLLVILFISFVPYNPSSQDLWLNKSAGMVLLAAYFVIGSLVGTIPIVRSPALTEGRKFFALMGYVAGAFLILLFFLIVALATRIRI